MRPCSRRTAPDRWRVEGCWLVTPRRLPAVLLLAAVGGWLGRAVAADSPRPNVVLLMADDLGYGDTGFQGNSIIRTPHLDRMAGNGLVLRRFYAAAPVCSPTRGSCLTGRNAVRFGIDDANSGRLAAREVTLAEVLRAVGYTTGHFGKWHLGTMTIDSRDGNRGQVGNQAEYSPPQLHGFDRCFSTEAKVPTFDPMWRPRGAASALGWPAILHARDAEPFGTSYWNEQGEAVTDNLRGDDSRVIMDRVIPFLRDAVARQQPFFAVVWFHAPHLPVVAGPQQAALYADYPDYARNYYGCITAMDEQIGRLRGALRELGVADDTLVAMASDNGPEGDAAAPGSTGGLRGRKRDLYEGGIRVPAILEWPDHIRPGITDFPAATSDYLPTILELVGTSLSVDVRLDGQSLVPLFQGDEPAGDRAMVFQYRQQIAVCDRRFKLISTNAGASWELYDLVNDPAEQDNLATGHPAVVQRLRTVAADWLASCRPRPEAWRSTMKQFSGVCLIAWCAAGGCGSLPAQEQPNVILIMTDDQGYGDVGAHGNSMIRTPHLDQLYSESVRLTDYHVDPTCSPTRSALMSGRYATRTGVWHTINGRSLMKSDEWTLAEMFRANRYRTAMFGKWHLGDNAPLRPMDQGFEYALWHKGGGVGQAPDYWGNDYFDDTYFVGDQPRAFSGYCTDIWFAEAIKFIGRHRDEPFFLYLATNAPHAPYHVADAAAAPYRAAGVTSPMAEFYGMISNLDANLGRLRRQLDAWGLADNTLLIFTTDNGTAAGVGGGPAWPGFNAGMRGQKGSQFEGGHRVPCWWYWPAGSLRQPVDVSLLSAHFDVLPTLAELCQLELPADRPPLDGVSLVRWLRGATAEAPRRTLFVHRQHVSPPPQWVASSVLVGSWRLVDGVQLFDLANDPGQQRNLAAAHPARVARMRADYERWWSSLTPGFADVVRIDLGGAENPTRLCCHDWLMPGGELTAWNQEQIRQGVPINGPWAVQVVEPGRYEFRLYRWPPHLQHPMDCSAAEITVGDASARATLAPAATEACFCMRLATGPTLLRTTLHPSAGAAHGAYFVDVRRLGDD